MLASSMKKKDSLTIMTLKKQPAGNSNKGIKILLNFKKNMLRTLISMRNSNLNFKDRK